jgi:hypothetical protein
MVSHQAREPQQDLRMSGRFLQELYAAVPLRREAGLALQNRSGVWLDDIFPAPVPSNVS